jgi:MFS family permease
VGEAQLARDRASAARVNGRRFALAALVAVAVLSLAAALPLTLLSGQLGDGLTAWAIGIPSAGVGFLVARRQPGNPLGWLFLVCAGCLFVSNDAVDYSYFVYRLGHHVPFGPLALVLGELWIVGIILLLIVTLLFPDGRPSSRFWSWALRALCALFVITLAAYAVATAGALAAHPLRIDASGGLSAIDSPHGWFSAVEGPAFLLGFAMAVGFIVRQVLSWRRAGGVYRQQLKWLAAGAAVTIASAIPASLIPTSGTATTVLLNNLFTCGLAALPVSMGVAILRYRLYEIDRIISRTLAYAIVTGLLVGAYAGLVLLATEVLRSHHSTVAVAAATLVAALFNPLRRRVQLRVDRRFNRARYDADQMVAAFAARLTDAVDLDSVCDALASVVQQALEPAHISVWVSRRT